MLMLAASGMALAAPRPSPAPFLAKASFQTCNVPWLLLHSPRASQNPLLSWKGKASSSPFAAPKKASSFDSSPIAFPSTSRIVSAMADALSGTAAAAQAQEETSNMATDVRQGPEELRASLHDKFDWNSQWYPAAVIQELDKRVPTPVTIMGRDLVVWWDRNGKTWQVWDDKCPHRLAPLSEGRINEKGELQCSYHGWCFAAQTGNCTLIPQAPADGPPVWNSNRACVDVYPSVAQEGLLWFWPDTRAEFKNIADSRPPPSIPSLADPTFKDILSSRDLAYSYEMLIENLMDPAHVPFAHHGLQGYRHMAKPLNYRVDMVSKTGYIGIGERGPATFVAPCIFWLDAVFSGPNGKKEETHDEKPAKQVVLVFICIPVSPGHSKVIFSFRRNFTVWIDYLIPRWAIHIRQMLVLDSDLYLLHIADRKLAESGASWERDCYVPTTSDAFVIAFRKWLKLYAGGAPDWRGKYNGLPPTPPKEQLMDRYWTHVKKCPHCLAALRFFQGAEIFLQTLSVGLAALIGAAALKPIPQLRSWSVPLVCIAMFSTLMSRWLSHFIKKTYHFHDYNHALVK